MPIIFENLIEECSEAWDETQRSLRALQGMHDVPSLPESIIVDVLWILRTISEANGSVPERLTNLYRTIVKRIIPHGCKDDFLALQIHRFGNYGICEPKLLKILHSTDKIRGRHLAPRVASAYKLLIRAAVKYCGDSFVVTVVQLEYSKLLAPYMPESDRDESQPDLDSEGSSCADCIESYRLLELPFGAGTEDINRAKRELAKNLHPDVWVDKRGGQLAEEQLKKVNAACDHLSQCRLPGSSRAAVSDALVVRRPRTSTKGPARQPRAPKKRPTLRPNRKESSQQPSDDTRLAFEEELSPEKDRGKTWNGAKVTVAAVFGLALITFCVVAVHHLDTPKSTDGTGGSEHVPMPSTNNSTVERKKSRPHAAVSSSDRFDTDGVAQAAVQGGDARGSQETTPQPEEGQLLWGFTLAHGREAELPTELKNRITDQIWPITHTSGPVIFTSSVRGAFYPGQPEGSQVAISAIQESPERSHVEGPWSFMAMETGDRLELFQNLYGSEVLRSFRPKGASVDLLLTDAGGGNQGEDRRFTRIVSVSNGGVQLVSSIGITYISNCASGARESYVVADQLFISNSDASAVPFEKHFYKTCSSSSTFHPVTSEARDAEQVLLSLVMRSEAQ
jgi:hypothetical protein